MSMPALARAAGLEAKSGADRIYRLERGTTSPSLHLTYSVAAVLGVTVDALCAPATGSTNIQKQAPSTED